MLAHINISTYTTMITSYSHELLKFSKTRNIRLPKLDTMKGQALALMTCDAVIGKYYITGSDVKTFFMNIGFHTKSPSQLITSITRYKRVNMRGKYAMVYPFEDTRVNVTFNTIALALDLNLFYKSSTRSCNDIVNKQREKMLEMMINIPDYTYEPDPLKWDQTRRSFIYVLGKIIETEYDRLVILPRGGRRYNYDFDVEVYTGTFLSRTIKVEFKYGTCLNSYPQILSIYVNNSTFQILHTNYNEFWYENYLKNYLSILNCQEMCIDKHKYLSSINNTNRTLVRNFIDSSNDTLKSKAFELVDDSIEKYLSQVTVHDINFDVLESRLRSQVDKYFVFCSHGVFSYQQLNKHLILDRTRVLIAKNNIKVYDQCGNVFTLLLRWKNHKGCAGPAWQISIKLN